VEAKPAAKTQQKQQPERSVTMKVGNVVDGPTALRELARLPDGLAIQDAQGDTVGVPYAGAEGYLPGARLSRLDREIRDL
jgi:hypothetical protein